MTCSELHPEIALLVGGELPPGRRPAVERHLDSCAACRRLAAALREDRRALGALADEPIDRAALERIRGRVSAAIVARRQGQERRTAARRRRSRALLALAAALGALALGLAVWLSGRRGGPDTPRQADVTAHAPAERGTERGTEPGTEPGIERSAPGSAGEPEQPVGSAPGDRITDGATDRIAETHPTPAATAAHPSGTRATDRLADRVAGTGPAADRPAPLEPTGPATAPADDRVAAAGHGPDNPSITIRIVSDDPDIVFYWLVDEPKEVPDDAAG